MAKVRGRPCPTLQTHPTAVFLRGRSTGVGYALFPALPKEPILPEKKHTPTTLRNACCPIMSGMWLTSQEIKYQTVQVVKQTTG